MGDSDDMNGLGVGRQGVGAIGVIGVIGEDNFIVNQLTLGGELLTLGGDILTLRER